ncbi:MAG: C69 family dipeptidase [Ignavibacteriales bacterium]|nr:C69 family dipeptidase [Ignavibacteriales bacterium]MBK7632113.1 C69 family dipeptidase [Ignavibacteriales bacterium]
MMRIISLLIIGFLIILTSTNLQACTNFIVTKGASVDGSVMISYTADSYEAYGELYHYPAAVYQNGAWLEIYEWDTGKFLGKIPQASVTYNVIGNMNEHQVVIGETTFGGREELGTPNGILDYGSMIYIALQRSKTAREAIKIMTDLVNEFGYYSSGESFSIGDANEAWILELIGKGEGNKGAVWVAVKIPDGYISGHANQSRITTFPLNDPENCLYAPDVISFAKDNGYFLGKDSEFNFSDAYAPLDFGAIRFCDARVWSLFRRCNSTMDKYISYIKGESLNRMPLYIKPDEKLSVHDVMGLMRDHYEGTELDMTKGIAAGPYQMPYRWRPLTWQYTGEEYFHERPISTPQTGFSFVSQARAHLPREVGGVFWFGVDDTYFTVYTPMYSSMSRTPYNYSKGVGSLSQFTWDSAFWVFNFVANFSYPRYSIVIDDVKKTQNEIEGKYFAQQENIELTALSLLKNSKGEAIDYLTNYSIASAENTYKTWKQFGEHLIVKYMDGLSKTEFFKPKNIGYPEEFKKMIVEESGDALKMKTIITDQTVAYNESIKKADELLNEKKYAEAKSFYEKALELKPGEEYPRIKIEKIKSVLSSIEELHKNTF